MQSKDDPRLRERVSPHFQLHELVATRRWDQFALRQVSGLDVVPGHGGPLTVGQRLGVLATTILEPIRAHVGQACVVNSGYRSPALNAATIGHSDTSQHVYGEAADICFPALDDHELLDLWKWIGWSSRIPFGQVIFEDRQPSDDNAGAWIHVSLGAPFRSPQRCGQRLTWTPLGEYRQHAVPPNVLV
jgi:zinc D-Ala-D-Ala carboxypeptidase